MKRVIDIQSLAKEGDYESSLRPTNFDHYIGQEQIKKNLKVFIQAASQRGDVLDHTLLFGPAGLGKTTLAHIIANEMGGQSQSECGSKYRKKWRFGRLAHEP